MNGALVVQVSSKGPRGNAEIERDIAQILEEVGGFETQEIENPNDSENKALIAVVPSGKNVVDLRSILDANREYPRRAIGTLTVQDLRSFVTLVNAFKEGNSRIFALPNPSAPKLTAVLDHHDAPTESEAIGARWGQHRVLYACPLSEEWKAWVASDAKVKNQAEFAEFLEDRIGDVVLPEGEHALVADRIAAQLSAQIGSPNDVMALSRGLEVNEKAKVVNAVRLSSGESTLRFEATHTDNAGAPISVPNLFFILIPVFFNGPRYLIAVRLRYRLKDGILTWFYQLHRPDLSIDHAFREIVSDAASLTELMTVLGTPEN